MRCFFVSSFLFSVFSIFLCVCVCQYIYIYIYMCNFLFSATKDIIVKILIDLFFSFVSFLVINFHQTGSSNICTFSKQWRIYVRASRISLSMNMNIWLDKKQRREFRLCYMWHPLVKEYLSYHVIDSFLFVD